MSSMSTLRKCLSLPLLALLFVAAAPTSSATADPAPAVAARAAGSAQAIERELVSALRGVEQASVTIVGHQTLSALRRGDAPAPEVLHGAGSGVLVQWNGTWVLTNAHVVGQPGRLEAVTSDGRRHAIEVRATGRSADLAIARFVQQPANLRPVRVPMARAGHLAVGTWATADGNPFLLSLDGHPAASLGVLSAVRPARFGAYVDVPTVQHDAEINPGNSGGPLWDLGGSLLGINGSIATRSVGADLGPSYTGSSFAIPVDAVRSFLTSVLGPDRAPPPPVVVPGRALRQIESEYRRAIQRVMPASVVCTPSGVRGRAAGYSSGVVVHPSGLVLSDGDVGLVWREVWVDGKRQQTRTYNADVDVRQWDPAARRWRTWRGRVVHRDRRVDTALIRMVEIPAGGMPSYVPPGRSGGLHTGQIVLAVGTSSEGSFGAPPSLNVGVVSAVDPGPDGFLYSSAGVNRGANGGPIVDLAGRLIATLSTYVDAAPDVPYGYLGKGVPIDRVLTALRGVPEARPLLELAGAAASPPSGGALEATVHRAGRRIRPSVVSIEITRRQPIQPAVPLDDRTVNLVRYTGPVSGVAVSDDLVVTSLYNLANLGERCDPLWKAPGGAAIDQGIADIGALRVHGPGGRAVEADLVGHDIRWGFALLRTRTPIRAAVPAAAPASAFERGRFLVTAGDPFGAEGRADPLTTLGILSKRHDDTAPAPWRGMWQTDAGAIGGNVGGAAVDLEGRILGMLTLWDPAKHGRNSGIGFVVPWSAIQRSVPALVRGEVPERGLMGIYFRRGPTPVIDRVAPGSGAEAAGLAAGDIIRSLDGHETPTVLEVLSGIGNRVKDERVALGVERRGTVHVVTVTLGARRAR
jgi:S1-C subfamily serine protease